LFFFGLFEHANDAVDCLAGIYGVKGTHDQVARFCSGHADFDGFPITHFSHEDHFRGLAESRTQTCREGAEIIPHLSLIEGCLFLLMHEFDGVLKRNNVNGLRLI
jgi:hypothetical protein